MALATDLDKAVRSVVPSINGVSVGKRDDKSTWRVEFSPGTSDQQKEAARQILAAFNIDSASNADPSTSFADDIASMKAAIARQQAFIDVLQSEAAKKLGG